MGVSRKPPRLGVSVGGRFVDRREARVPSVEELDEEEDTPADHSEDDEHDDDVRYLGLFLGRQALREAR